MNELPASVRLALWVTCAWRGDLSVSEALSRALPDIDHVAGDVAQLDLWADLGERALLVALPRSGDLTRVPATTRTGSTAAAQAGECVFVAGLGGILVPTLEPFGPAGDVGWRVDWAFHDAQPVPRHRLEMLDLRELERSLVTAVQAHSERLEALDAAPWAARARDAASGRPDEDWGLPAGLSGKAVRLITMSATVATLCDLAGSRPELGAGGLDAGTTARREDLLRTLGSVADTVLADATNVAVMALAGWRPA